MQQKYVIAKQIYLKKKNHGWWLNDANDRSNRNREF